jgi:type IV pilus assembly protein PilN
VLGVIYMGTMYLVLSAKRRHLDEEIGKAREEVARLKSIIEEVKGYEDKKKSLEEKIALINNLKTNQKGPVRLMDEVSKALPDLVWLTDMQIAGDQLTLKGRTLSPNAVATYLENLKKSPYFAEPVFKNLGREAGPQGIYSWEMAVTFTHGKPAGAPGAPAAPGTPGKPAPGPAGRAGAAASGAGA